MPATAAFCTISNDARPRHLQDVVGERHAAGEQLLPDHLVDRVVAPDVLADRDELPVGVEQTRRVEPARCGRTPAAPSRSRSGSSTSDVGGHREPGGTDAHRTAMSSSDGLAADAARRRREEVPRAAARRRTAASSVTVTTLYRCSSSSRSSQYATRRTSSGRDEALREQEPRRELEVAAGRAHRDRDALRLLPGTLHADLERLLGGERVGPLRPRRPPCTVTTRTGVTLRRTCSGAAISPSMAGCARPDLRSDRSRRFSAAGRPALSRPVTPPSRKERRHMLSGLEIAQEAAAASDRGGRRRRRDRAGRAPALRHDASQGVAVDPGPPRRPPERQARDHDRDHTDEGRRGQDHDLRLAHPGPRGDRQGRDPRPAGTVDGAGLRDQGRRHRRRLRPGRADGRDQPPLERRFPRDHRRPQPAVGRAGRVDLPRQPARIEPRRSPGPAPST